MKSLNELSTTLLGLWKGKKYLENSYKGLATQVSKNGIEFMLTGIQELAEVDISNVTVDTEKNMLTIKTTHRTINCQMPKILYTADDITNQLKSTKKKMEWIIGIQQKEWFIPTLNIMADNLTNSRRITLQKDVKGTTKEILDEVIYHRKDTVEKKTKKDIEDTIAWFLKNPILILLYKTNEKKVSQLQKKMASKLLQSTLPILTEMLQFKLKQNQLLDEWFIETSRIVFGSSPSSPYTETTQTRTINDLQADKSERKEAIVDFTVFEKSGKVDKPKLEEAKHDKSENTATSTS